MQEIRVHTAQCKELAGDALCHVYGDLTSKYLSFIIILLCIHTGEVWKESNITYTVRTYSRKQDLTKSDIDKQLAMVLKTWADVAKINFLSLSSEKPADITVSFVSKDHGDGSPFDGRGKVLGHANSQPHREVHFDDDEPWTITEYKGEIMLS
jgi:hypothetical protein